MEFPTLRCETISEINEDNTSLFRVIITRPIARRESSTTSSSSSLYSTFNIKHLSSVECLFLFFFILCILAIIGMFIYFN
jgi:hypothetical protein